MTTTAAVKERPILFSTQMIKAILQEKHPKRVTRRIITPQPATVRRSVFVPSGYDDGHGYEVSCPYGDVGDRLWVRETHQAYFIREGEQVYDYALECGRVHYDKNGQPWFMHYAADGDTLMHKGNTWRPSIHMPRWASRITLEITGRRAERLHDISEVDCCRELGAAEAWPGPGPEPYKRDMYGAFRFLWDSINADRGYGWSVNPWVWVVEFQRVQH